MCGFVYGRGVTSTPDVLRGHRGLAITWQYTAASLWIYVLMGMFGPVVRSVADLFDGERPIRSALVLAALVPVFWVSSGLISAARVGLGRDVLTWRTRAIALGASVLVLVVGWWPGDPSPFGLVVVPLVMVGLVAMDLPSTQRWTVMVVAVIVLVAVTAARFGLDPADYSFAGLYAVGFIGAIGLLMPPFQVWLWDLMLQVRSSGEAEAELAAVRERLRLAADLHDVQGHHLQVIALKAELASRQIDRDPAAARTTLAEVQAVAREAITETKDLVRGYRRTTLREEVANAAAVLEAAGARVEVDLPGDLDDALYALVLREATTNVLRHSEAAHVLIAGRPERFLVENDKAAPPRESGGTGLGALTARAAEAGARLDVTHGDGTFRIEVTR